VSEALSARLCEGGAVSQVTFAGGVLKAGGGGEGDDAAMDAASALVWEGRRFFLPGASARALRDAARAGGCSWDVELARFLRQERAELNDPYFEEYHAAGKLTGLEVSVSQLHTARRCLVLRRVAKKRRGGCVDKR
jgi:hypothetical protein